MADDLQERVMIELVVLMARPTTKGGCLEREREIVLALIAEIASENIFRNRKFSIVFSTMSAN